MTNKVAVILGSSSIYGQLLGESLPALAVTTCWGEVQVHSYEGGYVLFRHQHPHLLPHQIPYRAQIQALADLGCSTLLVTSSAGILDPTVPLFSPLLVSDLVMLDNRLGDGTPCTMFLGPQSDQGHLVLREGLFSQAVSQVVERLLASGSLPQVVFSYVPGPRTKTAAENRLLAAWGIQANSMTLGPEVVLANELGLSTAAVVVGHKYSTGSKADCDVAESLRRSRVQLETLAHDFLSFSHPDYEYSNQIFRF